MRPVASFLLEACPCLDSVVLAGQGVGVLCATYGSRLQWCKCSLDGILSCWYTWRDFLPLPRESTSLDSARYCFWRFKAFSCNCKIYLAAGQVPARWLSLLLLLSRSNLRSTSGVHLSVYGAWDIGWPFSPLLSHERWRCVASVHV